MTAKVNTKKTKSTFSRNTDLRKHRRRAYSKLLRALKKGIITRPDCCEVCGASCKPNGHHEDYDDPLNVKWMCNSCHAAHHVRRRRRVYSACSIDENKLLAKKALELDCGYSKTIHESGGKIKKFEFVACGEIFYSLDKNGKLDLFDSAAEAFKNTTNEHKFIYKFKKILGGAIPLDMCSAERKRIKRGF